MHNEVVDWTESRLHNREDPGFDTPQDMFIIEKYVFLQM